MSVQAINTAFTFLVGNRKTIKQSVGSGTIPAIFVTLLVILYVALADVTAEFRTLMPLDDFWAWYVILCLSLGFAVLGGGCWGWLVTRPIKFILGKAFSEYEESTLWVISSGLVWAATVVLTIWPLHNQAKVIHWILLVISVATAGFIGAIGGRAATRTSITSTTDYRELARFGAMVTGSLFVLLGLLLPTNETTRQGSPIAVLILEVAFTSFFCLFPYLLIVMPLSGLLSKVKGFKDHPHYAYLLTSAVFWAALGIILFNNSVAYRLLGVFLGGALGGFCGACGGWAVGILKHNVEIEQKTDIGVNTCDESF